jgi:hypothetical protein
MIPACVLSADSRFIIFRAETNGLIAALISLTRYRMIGHVQHSCHVVPKRSSLPLGVFATYVH